MINNMAKTKEHLRA